MPTDLAITLVSSFGIFFVGILVYFHDRKSISNLLFFFISFSTVLWAIANYFSLNSNPEQVLYWIRLVLFFAAPHAVLFFLFTLNFPNRQIVINKKFFVLGLAVLILTMGATISPYVFSNVQISNNAVLPQPGPLMPLFAGVIIASLLAGIILIIKKYIRAKVIEKEQWRLMLIGVTLSYVFLIVTNFILVIFFRNTSFIIFGPVYMLPTILGMGYAIIRHKLLNVKTIASEILTFVILSISLFEIFTFRTITELVLRISIFIIFFIFGIFLIRSVLKEVEQRELLQNLTQELEEFVGFAAHQVKGPMANMKGFAQLIEDGTYGKVPDEVKVTAVKIKNSADQTIELVNNLLNVRKIESGEFMKDFNFESVDIIEFLRNIADEYKIVAGNKNLNLSFESSINNLSVKMDRQKVHEVIKNLIENSIKYTDSGFIKIGLTDEGKSVLVCISDSGRGLSKELQAKLFQRFMRDEQTKREIQGTGLGLYIAKEIVTAHHGDIWAESEGEGKGSKFFVKLSKS